VQLINDVLNRYIQAVDQGFVLIDRDVFWLLNVLVILNIALSALVWAFSDDEVIVKFARKIVYIGFFVWMIQNWTLLTDILARSFMVLGFKAGGIGFPQDYVLNPGNIAGRGLVAIDPLLQAISDLTGPVAFFQNFPEIALLCLAVVAVLIAFFVIAIQCVVAILAFKLGSLAAFVLVPFGVLNKTTFIAERPLGWVVAGGVKLMVLTLVAGLGDAIFGQMQLDPDQVSVRSALDVALAAIVLMILSITATRLAGDLISGGPSLGAGAAAGALGGTAGAAYGGGQLAVSGGRGVYGASNWALSAVQKAAALKSGGTTVLASTAAAAGKGGVASAGTVITGGAASAGAGQSSKRAALTSEPQTGKGATDNAATTARAGAKNIKGGAQQLGDAGGGGGGLSAGTTSEGND